MSVELIYISQATITEVLTGNTDSSSTANRTVAHREFNESATLNSGTTPPVTTTANFIQALTAGTATVDLTSLTGTNGASVDGSGLKVQYLRIKNLGANTLTITSGAANGYDMGGAAFSVEIEPNQWFTFFGNDAAPDIAGADKTIDLVGTTSQTSEWTIVMG